MYCGYAIALQIGRQIVGGLYCLQLDENTRRLYDTRLTIPNERGRIYRNRNRDNDAREIMKSGNIFILHGKSPHRSHPLYHVPKSLINICSNDK